MQKTIYCPNCNKTEGIQVFIPMNVLLRASVDEFGEVETCTYLEKLIGLDSVFSFYSSIDDKTRLFVLDKGTKEEEVVSAYCTKCSETFQIKRGQLKITNANAS